MSRHFANIGTVAMLMLCIGQSAVGQELQKSRPVHKFPPRSLFDMYGVRAGVAPDMEWQSRFVKEASATPPPSPLIASNTNVSGGPVGTEEMLVYRDAPTSNCVTAALYPSFSTVFDKTFTTGPGSKFLQVIYTTQANVNDGGVGVVDGPAFQCLVTQGATTVPCANTDLLPFLIARTSDGKGNSVVTTYSGYVAVDPSTSTRVQVQVAVGISGTISQVCANNLILRY